MADYVLDTHACIFALTAPHKLGRQARKALQGVELGRDIAWLSAAVVAEVVLLQELRRTTIGVAEIKSALEEAPSWRFLPLDFRQIEDFAAFSTIRDPFDRLILAAARSLDAKLVTRDARLQDAKLVRTVWD